MINILKFDFRLISCKRPGDVWMLARARVLAPEFSYFLHHGLYLSLESVEDTTRTVIVK